MKRVHYGSITIDTTDEIAGLLIELAHESADSQHYRSQSAGGGFGMQPFAVGRVVPVLIAGYVNGSTTSTDVSLLVGLGIPIAAESIDLDVPAPDHESIVRDGLKQQLEAYASED